MPANGRRDLPVPERMLIPALPSSQLGNTAMSTQTERVTETHPFQAEVAELLRVMVHTVYSDRDVFLRELISNASDACDKLRYEAISKPELLEGSAALIVRLLRIRPPAR